MFHHGTCGTILLSILTYCVAGCQTASRLSGRSYAMRHDSSSTIASE
jgi:hypothetical protein